MSRLIIHADDFGLSKEINAGILQAYIEGNLTSTSIMASGAAFEEAVEICHTIPALDTGIHLTLVGERPVLNGSAIKSLLNREGCFHTNAGQFVRKYYCGQLSLKEIRCELEAQIQKVLNTDVPISHLDSHQHLHMLPRILSITVELARKYNIAAIRFPCESFNFSMLWELPLLPRTLQMLVLNGFCFLGRKTDILRTDHFIGFRAGGNMNKYNLLQTIDRLPQNKTIELMCHPGKGDSGSSYSNWQYHWQDELDALLDADVTALLQQKNISLISYRELAQGDSTQ